VGELKLGPRLVIAGTHSGVGKTTIATGLMAAFKACGVDVRSAKVGPDFIDPGYHSMATGHSGRNLDPWICGADVIPALAGRACGDGELLIIEGVMGLYDGAVDGSKSSTADVAELLDAPVVLVVDGSSMSGSVAALVRGFRDHGPSLRFGGVILNRVSSDHHAELLAEALAAIDVEVFGVVGRDEALTWRDRHLGLIPVAEKPDEVSRSLDALASVIESCCDLDRLASVAGEAPAVTVEPPPLPTPVAGIDTESPPVIAVAAGQAFTFCYQDNLEALEAAGARLVLFDPLEADQLPPGIDGLIVGGGFPEEFATRLSANHGLAASVRAGLAGGLPAWAECGGLLWLSESLEETPMVGAIKAESTMAGRLTLGYREAVVTEKNPVGAIGTKLRGHEFHYSRIEPGGSALTLTSRFNTRPEGFATPTMLATYLHQHLGGNPEPARQFVAACLDYQQAHS